MGQNSMQIWGVSGSIFSANQQPIVAMWRFSKSNGITEGFHNKMEMISRRAYGFRNFENYRLRVLTHCGWDGIINRVRMNAHPPLIG